MKPAQQQWVDDIRLLAQEATTAVYSSQHHRKEAATVHTSMKQLFKVQKATVEKDIDRVAGALKHSIKQVREQVVRHESEMAQLLQARLKAKGKLDAAAKPMRDMARRIDYHAQAMPKAEQPCDVVESELRNAAAMLQAAIGHLSGEVGQTEAHVAHMQGIRQSLADQADEREAMAHVNLACSHSHKAPLTLPTILGPGPSGSTTFSGVGNESPASAVDESSDCSPRSLNTLGSSRKIVRQDVVRLLESSSNAIESSMALRDRLRRASRAIDVQVAAALDAVAKSLNQRVTDNKQLQVILRDRLALSEKELEGVEQQIGELQALSAAVLRPMDAVQSKQMARKMISSGLNQVVGNDPVAPSTARELGTIAHGALTNSRQLTTLICQRDKLKDIISKLRVALATKRELLEVDERLLHIGLTPSAPPTPAMSARSGRAGGVATTRAAA